MYRPGPGALLCLLAVSLVACSETSVEPPILPPTQLAVSPNQGPVGTVVAIEGLPRAEQPPGELRVVIDGIDAAALRDSSGIVLATIPIFLLENGVPDLSAGRKLDFEIYEAEILVAGLEGVFTIQALPAAPGAAIRVADLLDQIVSGVESVASAMVAEPSLEHGYATAVFSALHDLIDSEDPNSLKSRLVTLEADDPASLALLEGILSGSGGLSKLEEIAALASQLQLQSARATTLTEHDLAARMQLYVMVHDFGQQVIGQTASTWGSWLAPIFGGIGLVGVAGTVAAPGVAVAGTIGTVLGLINFAINNVALGYLPSHIDSFELQVDTAFVLPGEVPSTEIWITASNQPASITVLDMVDLVLTAMGVLPGSMPAGHPRRVALIQTVNYFVGIIRSQLSGYANGHPGSDLAFDVASIPHMTWTAQVTDTRFVAPRTLTPAIINPASAGILAWRASLLSQGEGRIFAQIQSGPQVTSLVQLPGYTYNAGAFGEEILATDTKTVIVAPELEVTTRIAATIAPGGANGLEVRVRSLSSTGELLPRAGVSISVGVSGGTADPSSGSTNADGILDTIVSLDAGSTEVNITVTASDEYGREATATDFSTAQSLVRVTNSSVSAGGGIVGQIFGPGESAGTRFYREDFSDSRNLEGPQSAQAMVTETRNGSFEHTPGTSMNVSATMSGTGSVSVEASGGGLNLSLSAKRSSRVTLSNPPGVESDGYWTFYNKATAEASAEVYFVIEGDSALVDVTGSLPFDGAVIFRKPGGNQIYVCWSSGGICYPGAGATDFSGVLGPGTYLASVLVRGYRQEAGPALGNTNFTSAREGSASHDDEARMSVSITPRSRTSSPAAP